MARSELEEPFRRAAAAKGLSATGEFAATAEQALEELSSSGD